MTVNPKQGYVKPPLNLHGEPYVDDLNSVFETIHEHDDRSLVLTLAAFAEDSLQLLLLAYMREPKQAADLVHGFNAPLGTFSARIKAALVLGLIRKDQHDTLEQFRKIRNKFAHDWQGVSLDRQDIKGMIDSFPDTCRMGLSSPQSDRKKLERAAHEVISSIRLLAKSLKRRGAVTPLLMGNGEPVQVSFVLVDDVSDRNGGTSGNTLIEGAPPL